MLEKLLPAFTLQYVPVYTSGSGNCMYNMLSIALTGTEQYMCHLRLLTACSLITHRDHMVEVMKPTAQVLCHRANEMQLQLLRKQKMNGWTCFVVLYEKEPGEINITCTYFLLLWKGQFVFTATCEAERFNMKGGSCRTLLQQLQPQNYKGFLMPRTSDKQQYQILSSCGTIFPTVWILGCWPLYCNFTSSLSMLSMLSSILSIHHICIPLDT